MEAMGWLVIWSFTVSRRQKDQMDLTHSEPYRNQSPSNNTYTTQTESSCLTFSFARWESWSKGRVIINIAHDPWCIQPTNPCLHLCDHISSKMYCSLALDNNTVLQAKFYFVTVKTWEKRKHWKCIQTQSEIHEQKNSKKKSKRQTDLGGTLVENWWVKCPWD